VKNNDLIKASWREDMANLLDVMEPVFMEMRNTILKEVSQQIRHPGDLSREETSPEIQRLAKVLEEANAWRAVDRQSTMFLKMSALLLAVYRTLSPFCTDTRELLDRLQSVVKTVFFADGLDRYLHKRFGISPDAPEEAWNRVCANFKKLGEEQFGTAWEYEQGIKDHRRCFVNIRKCGFADFFLENQAREVLYLLCALDYVWADALEAYGIRLERPTSLAEGADACRFQFFEAKHHHEIHDE
jgi:hypothetical protein